MERLLTEEDELIIATLFALPGAVDRADIARVLGMGPDEAAGATERLAGKLQALDTALIIRHVGDKYELAVAERCFDRLRAVTASSREAVITDTMLEALAIILERGSATRVDIEDIRGVKSDFAVSRLVEYGLIEEIGRKDLPGRPIIFAPTDECKRHFGIGEEAALEGVDPGVVEAREESAVEAQEESADGGRPEAQEESADGEDS